MTPADARALALPRPGDVLAGKLRIEQVLGEGGMGLVYLAEHVDLHERVAVKVLHPKRAADPAIVARFMREARTAVKIRSEHVARVMDVGQEGGLPYIAMEYLEGEDLAARIDGGGAFEPAEAVGLVLQACEALACAHALGVVHRDLKPSNLFLTEGPDGAPLLKVLDFGISKAGDTAPDSQRDVTTTSDVLGSPGYMSPEQMRATRDVDARSDVWSLGMIVWEMLVGRPMFAGKTFPEICAEVLAGRMVPLGRAAPHVPEGLALVVDRCLALEPQDRFPDVVALAGALAPFGPPGAAARVPRIARLARPSSDKGRSWRAAKALAAADTMPATPAGSGAPTATATPTPWGHGPSGASLAPASAPKTERKRSAGLAALAALVAAGAVGAAMGRRDGGAAPVEAPASGRGTAPPAMETTTAAAPSTVSTASAPAAPRDSGSAPAGASATGAAPRTIRTLSSTHAAVGTSAAAVPPPPDPSAAPTASPNAAPILR
jgi:tRNA A-37 threonylcarbamoyl transferase component Bud32